MKNNGEVVRARRMELRICITPGCGRRTGGPQHPRCWNCEKRQAEQRLGGPPRQHNRKLCQNCHEPLSDGYKIAICATCLTLAARRTAA
jgi:hypothetical protein